MEQYDVVIIGGGLAGLTAAIHLSLRDKKILVIEKNQYPNHKVCGEYVSREVVPYLNSMGVPLDDAVQIDRLQISNKKGSYIETQLPLGGIGISRYSFDQMLYNRAIATGVDFVFDTVNHISFENNSFRIGTTDHLSFSAPLAIGAFGKRSGLDKTLNRRFTSQLAPWLAVKVHYNFPEHPDDLVGVHAFNGGYGGLSKTESKAVNFCYLAHYNSFKRIGDIDTFNQVVVSQNPFLKNLILNGEILFAKPMTIAQVSFLKKKTIENHILMCGDAAGLIHPLCGNGMAMAIHSAQILSDLIIRYLEDDQFRRADLETSYEHQWKQTFATRIWWGRRLQSLLLNPTFSNGLFHLFSHSHRLTQEVIRKTHGKLLEVS